MSANIDVEVDPQIAAGEIADTTVLAIVPAALHPAAGAAGCFLTVG
jgi:hypothetical protein